MIARLWVGRTKVADGDKYLEYLKRTGVPDCQATPGNRGVFVLRRDQDGVAEFFFLSLWDSFDAIRGFAGDDITAARYYAEDRAYHLAPAPHVTHYEVAAAEGFTPPRQSTAANPA